MHCRREDQRCHTVKLLPWCAVFSQLWLHSWWLPSRNQVWKSHDILLWESHGINPYQRLNVFIVRTDVVLSQSHSLSFNNMSKKRKGTNQHNWMLLKLQVLHHCSSSKYHFVDGSRSRPKHLYRGVRPFLLTSVLYMTLNYIWYWHFSPGALVNVEYLFTFWSNLIRSGRTYSANYLYYKGIVDKLNY